MGIFSFRNPLILGIAAVAFFIFRVMTAHAFDYAQYLEKEGDHIEVEDAKSFFASGIRKISIIVTEDGYYPDKFSVFEGERVHFFVTSTLDRPSCINLPEKRFFAAAKKGQIFEGLAAFDAPGVVEFGCPSEKFKGKITVMKLPAIEKANRFIQEEQLKKAKPEIPKDGDIKIGGGRSLANIEEDIMTQWTPVED